jgi:hypothetical protein
VLRLRVSTAVPVPPYTFMVCTCPPIYLYGVYLSVQITRVQQMDRSFEFSSSIRCDRSSPAEYCLDYMCCTRVREVSLIGGIIFFVAV